MISDFPAILFDFFLRERKTFSDFSCLLACVGVNIEKAEPDTRLKDSFLLHVKRNVNNH